MKSWAYRLRVQKRSVFHFAMFVVSFGLLALIIILANSQSTSPFIEPESGAVANGATAVDNTQASGLKAVKFGPLKSSILWGIGDQLGPAQQTPIYQQAEVNMVTGWYNGPGDWWWMGGYENPSNSGMSDTYGKNEAIELVVWLADGTDNRPASESATSGKTLPEYALSNQFMTDLSRLINIYKGHGPNYGPLYVVLFTEFTGTYSYDWPGSPYTSRAQYDAALMTQYKKAVTLIHSQYDQAEVALGFGGYTWNPAQTNDLSSYESAIAASDFVSVQAMQSCTNTSLLGNQIKYSVKQLGSYGKPVMISHFKIWNDSTNPSATDAQKQACATNAMANFEQEMFNDATLNELKSNGLFAWDFMTDSYINNPGPQFDTAKNFINQHAAGRGMPSR